ncbi:fibrillin-2 [Drosophila subpulchrella]|uniref:fibrillin-2 n=1 Tax=Drosophila subpulchrella TaxID=1486046 RepID=UPI0018A160CD|nr:fibrillin-2 [Drosophila subpulchrella]XP_037722426.1 fibrillin-2 [Drosophila subpulchrella]XP_037722427.1 fibrillin-2 [Drosophila subpulchrella]XP_037722428.1 fibrillin-2 [Drosophila subpulchrella]XP_037722429.1 fibrillin-2 [Drosophila subpulchrella]XP_037722431.1 fibrillin-2 [Drosophila subpulchrella]
MATAELVIFTLTYVSFSTAYLNTNINVILGSDLDTTCHDVDPPKIRNGYFSLKTKWSGLNYYQAAIYHCSYNYELMFDGDRDMLCSKGSWIGNVPECIWSGDVEDKDCRTYDGCSHRCNELTKRCECYEGYTLNTTDFTSCVDIDECKESNGGCSHNCMNLPGEHLCLCNDGYTTDPADGRTCVDIDECADPDLSPDCQAGCDNLDGSYKCRPTMVGRVEPSDPIGFPRDGILCKPGFNLSSDGSECQDINECELVDHDPNTGRVSPRYCKHKCENTVGSYICHCPEGYHLLEDHQSCALNGRNRPAIIIPKAKECPSGFQPSADGTKCQDINECELVDHDPNTGRESPRYCKHKCQNTVGSYICHCPEGYHLLEDHKSCALNVRNRPAIIIPKAKECPSGFGPSADGTKCQDINECELVDHDPNTGRVSPRYCKHKCENTVGSYICHCPEGYHLLKDHKSCALNVRNRPAIIIPKAKELDPCPSGLERSADGIRCQVTTYTSWNLCSGMQDPRNGKAYCYGPADGFFQSHCIFICDEGYALTDSKTRTCDSSGTWSDSEPKCVPINLVPTWHYSHKILPKWNVYHNTRRNNWNERDYSVSSHTSYSARGRRDSMRQISASYDQVGIPLS